MEKDLAAILSFVFEKYLMPSVIALIMSIVIYGLTPSDLPFVKKLDTWLFILLGFLVSFAIVMLVITFAKYIKKKINIFISKRNYEKEKKAYEEENIPEGLEKFWSIVDGFSDNDYKLMMEFIENKNEPIIKEEKHNYNDWLLNSDWVHKTLYKKGERKLEVFKPSSPDAIPVERCMIMPDEYKYILTKGVYEIASYSYNRYGRISHFKRNV